MTLIAAWVMLEAWSHPFGAQMLVYAILLELWIPIGLIWSVRLIAAVLLKQPL
jgi:hypothetical protein